MPMFRKKPLVIEARQYTSDPQSCLDICQWAEIEHSAQPDEACCGIEPIEIPTPEGDMTCQVGDWVIKGVKGEFYPCKPDIFDATYEAIHPE